MRYYFAPMEGLTDSVYRRLHHKYFPGIDCYYMPFLSPTIHRTLTHKEDRELPMAADEDFAAVPQVLTKVPEDFLWAAEQCRDRGYTQINLNAGCPSGTVVSKGKGAGLLSDPDALDRFLDAIFSRSPLPISVKTRLGIADPSEFPAILDVYNRYPITELTIHPRVRKAFYKGSIDEEMLRYCMENSRNPVCCNGNLTSTRQIDALQRQYPRLQSVMLGRGLIADPGMLTPGGTTVDKLEPFMDELLETYIGLFGGSRNAMFRMKESWSMLIGRFEGSEKLGKQLRKTTDLAEYQSITKQIFRTLPLKKDWKPEW